MPSLELFKPEPLSNLFLQGKTAELNGDGSELSDDTFADDDNLPEEAFNITRKQNCSWSPGPSFRDFRIQTFSGVMK